MIVSKTIVVGSIPTSPARDFSGLLYNIFMERPRNKTNWLSAIGMTNKVLGAAGTVLGAAAKAGGNVLKNANDAQHQELAMAIIEPIMFVGNVRWISGGPRPPFKASLNPDERERFIKECNKLTSRGIALDAYVRSF